MVEFSPWSARSGSCLFFATDPAAGDATRVARPADLVAPSALALAGAAMAVFAGPLHDFGLAAAEQLVAPAAYVETVLGNGGEAVRR